MKTFSQHNFNNQKVIIRVDFNVPLDENFNVTDDTRIRESVPTIKKILNDGGSVVLMSHLGRPKNGYDEKYSLKHIISSVEKNIETPVKFAKDCIGKDAYELSKNLKNSEVLLLENLRFYPQETAGDINFAEQLSKHANFFVNDAFGTAHRAHASTTIIAQFFPNKKSFGFLLEKEIESVDRVLKSGEKPLTAIVGGAKVSSKISIIENLFNAVDNIIIGGGMAFTFVKAMGGSTGNSLVEQDYLETAKAILTKAKEKKINIYIPIDTVIADGFSNDANKKECNINQIPDGWMGLDVGQQSIEDCKKIIKNSKTILWNGPMGVFEFSNFENGTKQIALAIVEATKNGAFSLVGGGDSVAAVNKFGLAKEVSHVSTGGGAMLEFLEGQTLPGIAAIQN
ncbi:MAG: phosphoglycerate kinase [Bacteroidia bacterium]